MMTREWQALLRSTSETSRRADAETVRRWDDTLSAYTAEINELRNRGQWLGGPRTLLHVLRLHHRELVLTSGLAWLLDPDGYHRLGDRVLRGLLTLLPGVDAEPGCRVRIHVEEFRMGTRADLVLRMPGRRTILIEAKVWAAEQPTQLDRLAELWAEEHPTLVLLSRDLPEFRTAVASRCLWRSLLWRDVARVVRAAAFEAATSGQPVTAGVHDWLETLETFHS